jgi:iron complex outermembrane receptor protein
MASLIANYIFAKIKIKGNEMKFYKKGLVMAIVASNALVGFTHAQNVDSIGTIDSKSRIDEIVVTARKRGEESLQDIPATITAFGASDLSAMQVTDFSDFAYQVPGLTFTDQGPGEKRYIIRGVQSGGQQQVAVYYDEVALPGVQGAGSDSGSQTTDLKIYDMERVEVLKGPQGTVFGANSQTGTVRFISNKPNLYELEASINGDTSNMEHSENTSSGLNGMVNVPLVDGKLGLRVVGYKDSEAGYIDNVRLGFNDINSSDTTGMRVNLRWAPTDTFTLDTMYWFQDRYSGGSSSYTPYDSFHQSPGTNDQGANDDITDTAAIPTFYQTGDYVVGDFTNNFMPDEQTIFSLTGVWDLPWATMTATASHYERDFGYKFDSTWVITTFGMEAADRLDLLPALTDQEQSLSQDMFEVRLNSTGDGRLQWLAGAFTRERDSTFRSYVPVVNESGNTFSTGQSPQGSTGLPGGGIIGCDPCVFARFADKTIEEKALFGELTYELSDRLDATIGLRWFDVEQSDLGQTVFQFALFDGPAGPQNTVTAGQSEIIQKYKLAYELTDDSAIYLTASQGFRLGGTNNQGIVAVPMLYEADELWNYEVGYKSMWMDDRLSINTAIFMIDWDNLQISGLDPTGAFNFIGNAGSAEVKGIEVEVTAKPNQDLAFTMGLSYLPTKELTEDQVSDSIQSPGKKGDDIPRIPELTLNATATYNFELPVDSVHGWLRGEYSYKDGSNTELDPTSSANRYGDDYSITNLRLGFSSDEINGDIVFYIENVFDEDGDLFVYQGSSRPTAKVTNTPRQIGLSITKRF